MAGWVPALVFAGIALVAWVDGRRTLRRELADRMFWRDYAQRAQRTERS